MLHRWIWIDFQLTKHSCGMRMLQNFNWSKEKIDESRKQCDRLRDLCTIAEKLGCNPTQLSIAWSLKHEPVQCLLLGAITADQLHQSLQALQVILSRFAFVCVHVQYRWLCYPLQLLPRLSSGVMLELERILENKPVRPPAISTLALRWQSACPPGQPNAGALCGAESPKEEEISIGEESKEASKVGFCEIQWPKETLDTTNKFSKSSTKRTDSLTIRDTQNKNSSTSNLISNNSSRPDNSSTSSANIKSVRSAVAGGSNGDEAAATTDPEQSKKSIRRNTSMISFKSLDFGLKQIYSNMKNKHKESSGSSKPDTTSSSKTSIAKAPYLKIDTVDKDSDENLLTFPRSPYSPRGSFDNNASQYLSTNQPDYSRSSNNSPSPYLCINTPPNLRRSSTSDIIDKKPPGTPAADARRPSTSDLLRRARERKGSEGGKSMMNSNRMGRSVSQGGLPRGGRMGRRTSMAF